MELFSTLAQLDASRVVVIRDEASGLRALIAIDDTTLGPAAGGVRTRAYADTIEALEDVTRLARAMTIKCAIAGLDAGGGKAVVLASEPMDRRAVFRALGRAIDDLGGLFRTAGDYGTSHQDLVAMSETCRFVHTNDDALATAVARGVRRSIEAANAFRGGAADVSGLRVAVQGAGAIGAAVVRELVGHGATVFLADIDEGKAHAVARETEARAVGPNAVIHERVDVFSPCAVADAIDASTARVLGARIVCGAANNAVTAEAARVLHERGVVHVPDAVASAGAVIDGIGRTVMGLTDRNPLIDNLAATTTRVLELSRERNAPTPDVVARVAAERIAAARNARAKREERGNR